MLFIRKQAKEKQLYRWDYSTRCTCLFCCYSPNLFWYAPYTEIQVISQLKLKNQGLLCRFFSCILPSAKRREVLWNTASWFYMYDYGRILTSCQRLLSSLVYQSWLAPTLCITLGVVGEKIWWISCVIATPCYPTRRFRIWLWSLDHVCNFTMIVSGMQVNFIVSMKKSVLELIFQNFIDIRFVELMSVRMVHIQHTIETIDSHWYREIV